MAVKTTTTGRTRNELITFTESTLAALVTAFNAEEASRAADTDKTWMLTPISFFYDGTDFHLVAYASYVETETEPTGQLPPLP